MGRYTAQGAWATGLPGPPQQTTTGEQGQTTIPQGGQGTKQGRELQGPHPAANSTTHAPSSPGQRDSNNSRTQHAKDPGSNGQTEPATPRTRPSAHKTKRTDQTAHKPTRPPIQATATTQPPTRPTGVPTCMQVPGVRLALLRTATGGPCIELSLSSCMRACMHCLPTSIASRAARATYRLGKCSHAISAHSGQRLSA